MLRLLNFKTKQEVNYVLEKNPLIQSVRIRIVKCITLSSTVFAIFLFAFNTFFE